MDSSSSFPRSAWERTIGRSASRLLQATTQSVGTHVPTRSVGTRGRGWLDRRSFLAALTGVPGAALLSGCGRGRADESRTLRLAYRTDFKSFDPAVGFDVETMQLMRLLYEGLLDVDDDMRVVPWLADGTPETSPDRRAYTFRVKPGVRFANGRELEAGDFVYALERTLDPRTRSPGEGFLRNIRGAKEFQKAREHGAAEPAHVAGLSAPDRRTLTIGLEEPDLSFPYVLTLPFTYAVPGEEVERLGKDFAGRSCGTGPFVLAEWARGTRLRLARNPHDRTPGRPGFDAVEVYIGYDDLTETMMFERGEIDVLHAIPRPDFVRLTTGPRWRPQLRSMPSGETEFLIMNCELEPFTDRRVRQAVCHAVDRERVLKVLSNQGVAANGILPPGMPGHDPARRAYPHDPDEARRLLAEAGYPDGFEVALWVLADAERWKKVGEVIAQDLGRVGVAVKIQETAEAVFNTATGQRKEVAFSLYGWAQDYPDPRDFLDTLFNGERIVESNCNNMAFYDNPEVNGLLGRAASETDPSRRLDFYRRAEEIVVRDAPFCFLYHPIENRMCQPWVKGFALHPMWFVRYEKLSLERP